LARGVVTFSSDRCKACGLCILFCPRQIMGFDKTRINILGYHPVSLVKPEDCNGCGICAMMCPDLVIEVGRE
jgi:2-oxoglutarate ferredoxin oxidoreductase subunit delta